MIKDSEKADLYVLPEMFSTGFATDPDGIVEKTYFKGTDEECCASLEWMVNTAAEMDAAIAGSVAVQTSDGCNRNRLYFVMPDGDYCFYDKHHLFTYGGEDKRYTAGNESVIVEWRGVRFMLQVCYDLRFPKYSRNLLLASTEEGVEALYDCLLYVANWPDSRRKVWDVLLRARALENQCFVAGVNRVGDDLQCHYDGGTVLVDAYGKDLVMAENNKACSVTADLDMDRLSRFREKFPVLKDCD